MQDAIPSHNHFHYCLHILTVNHNWMQCVMRRSTDDYKLARLDGKKQVFLELRTPYISHWQRRGLCCTLVNQIGFPDSPLQFLWKRGFDETGKALLFEGKHGWTYLLSDFPSWTTATKHWSRLKFSCIFDLFATEFVFMCFLYLYSCVWCFTPFTSGCGFILSVVRYSIESTWRREPKNIGEMKDALNEFE